MKKILLLFTAMFMSVMNTMATTVTYTPSEQGYTNAQVLTSATAGDVTFAFDRATGTTSPTYYDTGTALRLYGGNTMKISVPEGQVIKTVTCTFASGETANKEITANKGTWSEPTWTGSEQNVTFTIEIGSGHRRFASIEVTYEAGESTTPDEPDQPAEPVALYTVAEALAVINSGNIPTEAVQVKGIISSIDEVSTSYGNATYTIKDALTDADGLMVYRGYWLNGDKFTTGNEIAVGGTVTVEGKLVLYGGNTPEITSNKVIEYTAPEGGETPDPTVPETDNVTFDFTDISSLGYTAGADQTEIDLTGVTLTSGVISLTSEAAESASTKPRLYYGSGSSAGWTYRFYKDNTITISAADGYLINYISFEATNLNNSSIVFSTGTFSNNVWTSGDTGVQSFTITKTETGNNPTIKKMTVYYASTSAVDAITTTTEWDANAPIYNLAGQQVTKNYKGVVIQNGRKFVQK